MEKAKETVWNPPTTIWNFMFISIFLANMAMNMGLQMSNSLLSKYADSLGTPAAQVGLLGSSFAITALLFRFVSGPAMNAWSRKLLLLSAMGLMTIAFLGFSFAPNISNATGIPTIAVLIAFRLLQGIGNAFGNSCCMTIVSDVLPKNKFSAGMGYYGTAQVVSQAIGPALGDSMASKVGYHNVYIIFAGIMIVSIILASFVKTAPHDKVPFNLRWDNMVAKEAITPAMIIFWIAIGYTSIQNFLLLYAQERGIVGAGYFFTVYAITAIITRPIIGNITEKLGFTPVGITCAILTAVSLIMIGYANGIVVLLLAAIINAFGYGALQPMVQSLSLKAVSDERRGSASGTYYIGMDAGTLIGPTIFGIFAGNMGYASIVWAIMSIPVFLSALFILVKKSRIRDIETNFQMK
ncbi:MAG: MFS transporter [Pseudobutyrivibrio sp.]|nr:MFS transporter [Pseudobutyrivibrio sp.]